MKFAKVTSINALALAVVLVLGLVTTQSVQAQTFTVLHNFAGYPSDGRTPKGISLRDTAGNLYGTTYEGGPGKCHDLFGKLVGCGTVFKLDPTTGKETILYSFMRGADGAYPWGGLVRDAKGNLYGTCPSSKPPALVK